MSVRVVETSSLGAHAVAWDEAVAAMALPSPFLRSWWLDAIADGSSVFLLVLDGERLLGGLALRRSGRAWLAVYQLLGSGTLCADHLDVVAAPKDAELVTAALRAWATRPGNRIFRLDGLSADSRVASWLPGARTSELDEAPYEPLPAEAGDYLAARPRSFRKTVRRARNRFDEVGARITRPEDVDAALDLFAELHRARGDRQDLLDVLPQLRRAVRHGAQADEAWVSVLASDDAPIAVSIAFHACGRLSLYQTARSIEPGLDNSSTVLNLAAIDRAIDAGSREVDLLRGEEPYKRHYARSQRRLLRVYGAHGLIARAGLAAFLLARRAARTIRGLRASVAGSGS